MTKKPEKNLMREVLKHSNWIEREYSQEAGEDAMRAWRYAYKNIDKINVKYVLKIHEILIRRLNLRIAGKIRNCDVMIAGQIKHYISHALLKEQINSFCKMVNRSALRNIDKTKKKKEERAKYCHVVFEGIHPFEDGNGRTGRLLYNIHLIKLGLGPHLILGPAEGKDNTPFQMEYYKWFE